MTMMTLHRLLFALALAPAAVACGVKTVGDLDDTDGGSGDGSGDGSSGSAGSSDASASASSTTAVATTGETSSGGSSSASDDGSCPPFDGSTCDPQEQFGPAAAAWSFDGDPFGAADLVDVSCNVADFADDDTTMTITLECDEQELSQHTITAPHDDVTPLNLGVGTLVRLSHHAQMPFWREQWFNLSTPEGRLILGGVQASAVLPSDAPDFFAPLGVTLLDDVCDAEPDCDQSCGPIRRDAIGVALDDGEPVAIYDGNADIVGAPTGYTVVVGDAYSQVGEPTCADTPKAWFEIIVYDSSEG